MMGNMTPEQIATATLGDWERDTADERTVTQLVVEAIESDRAVRAQCGPSDAQVEVAWRTWLGLEPDEAVMGNWIHEARMNARRALGAAFKVWGEGR